MFAPGDVIPYFDMCREERINLQRGMNFRLGDGYSVLLMSVRQGAPYADRIESDGRILVYEQHDAPAHIGGPDPKRLDQPGSLPSGKLTQNGLFHKAASEYKQGKAAAELVRVYEKIMSGVWVYNGLFHLVDAWEESASSRKVFKFKLEAVEDATIFGFRNQTPLEHTRLIPKPVKLEVWRRDKGRCVMCGCNDNLHFDHIIPYSKGGSSLVAQNIQLLCARHNLAKNDRIE